MLRVAVAGAILLLALGIAGPPAEAVPCVEDSAAAYEELGSSGCTIGDKTFSDFDFTAIGVDLDNVNVTVKPVTDALAPGDVGFELIIAGLGVTSGAADLALKYTVSAPSAIITDAHLSFTGSAVGTGLASVAEKLCPVGGTCLDDILEVFDSPFATVTQDFTFFTPVQTIKVSKDIAVLAGNKGFATISIVTQTFTQVPEPATLVLLGAGLIGAAFMGPRLRPR